MNRELMHDVDDSRQDRLPGDLRTILLGMWKCRWPLAAWPLVSVAVGIGVSLSAAPRIWSAEAVLLYQPPSDELMAGMYVAPSIHSQLNMVKVQPNLAETRLRLRLPCTLYDLGAACKVRNPRDSQLLVFQASWHSPDQVADIANTLSEVFMTRQQRLRRGELAAVIREMDSRLALLHRKMDLAGMNDDAARKALQRELESYRNRINTADEMYEKAITELKAVQRQLADLDVMEKELRAQLLSGEGVMGQSETISSLNVRVERLREKILDTRQNRMSQITTQQWEERLKFSERLLSYGFLSREAYENELAELEKHKTLTEDDEEIEQLKRELDNVFSRMRPNSPEGVESTPLVQSLAIQKYNIRLQLSAAQERVKQLERSRVRLDQEYQAAMKTSPVESNKVEHHVVVAWHREVRQLEEALAKVRAVSDSDTSDFEYISRATKPSLPKQSYRKVVCASVAGGSMSLALLFTLILQLTNPTLRSASETRLKLERSPVVMLPVKGRGNDDVLTERVRSLAHQVQSAAAATGSGSPRLLVTSAGRGEGRTLLSRELANYCARRGGSVVVIDASIREPAEYGPGLSEYLAGQFDDIDVMLTAGQVDGVRHIYRGGLAIVPDLLASTRMELLLQQLSRRCDLVIIDGPPAELHADSEMLARQCNGLIVVAQANVTRARDVRRVLQRLEATGAPLLSIVLNETDPVFLHAAV